ncbi:MAG: hypothetical protein IPH63_07975 [Flavobacteriales bacterium]|nr:hypothetical protein [Flavobacteriales bacterium]
MSRRKAEAESTCRVSAGSSAPERAKTWANMGTTTFIMKNTTPSVMHKMKTG